jgi:hypothetical protein
MWNGKFWLVPPLSFREFNVKLADPEFQFRPNVVCELSVDFDQSGDPHKTIDVANLNLAMLVGKTLDPGRSGPILFSTTR